MSYYTEAIFLLAKQQLFTSQAQSLTFNADTERLQICIKIVLDMRS
jgi:hypothetical protein